MFKALKYPIFHQMFIQWTLSPIDLTTYNTNLRLFDIHARGLVQVSPKRCGNKIHKSSEFIVLQNCIAYEGRVLSLVASLGIKDVPKQHVRHE